MHDETVMYCMKLSSISLHYNELQCYIMCCITLSCKNYKMLLLIWHWLILILSTNHFLSWWITFVFWLFFYGQWVSVNGHYKFNGHEAKGVSVSYATTYEDLLVTIVPLLHVLIDESIITMKYLLHATTTMPLIKISCNEDVQFFLDENSGNGLTTPLYVIVEPRLSNSTEPQREEKVGIWSLKENDVHI